MDKQKQQEAYRDYVKWKTPVHNLPLNMAKAFVTGGTICLLGQMILNKCETMGLDQDVCGSVTSVSLILLSVLLTGWTREMGRRRRAGSDYGVCEFGGGSCH